LLRIIIFLFFLCTRVQAATKDKSACDLPCHAKASPARTGKKDKKEKNCPPSAGIVPVFLQKSPALLFDMVRQIVQAVILQRESKSHKK